MKKEERENNQLDLMFKEIENIENMYNKDLITLKEYFTIKSRIINKYLDK